MPGFVPVSAQFLHRPGALGSDEVFILVAVTPVEASTRPLPASRILVIEDERSIASAIAARLRSEGYAVETAFDGPSGLDSYARHQPDLVVKTYFLIYP